MKKFLKHYRLPVYLSILIVIFICFFIIYHFVSSVAINRDREIEIGNEIIFELHSYFLDNGKFPDDIYIIENIYKKVFSLNDVDLMTTRPFYRSLGDEFILEYIYGFDPPYLFYYSKNGVWEYGFPPY